MKVITQEALYMKNMGYFEAQVWKRDSNIVPSLFFSHFFFFGGFFVLFFMGFFGLFYLFFVRSLILTCGGIIVSIILSSLGQCSSNDDHHTFIYLQLDTQNKI